jgi:hypothetical protein
MIKKIGYVVGAAISIVLLWGLMVVIIKSVYP